MYNEIIVTAGPAKGRRFQIDEGRGIRVGRSIMDADLVLDDKGVSRSHAVFEVVNKQCFVTDLGSYNGTYVNELALEAQKQQLLTNGDRLKMGNTELQFFEKSETTPKQDQPLQPLPIIPQQRSTNIRLIQDQFSPQNTIRKHYDGRNSTLIPAIEESANPRLLKRLEAQLEAIYSMGSVIHTERNLEKIFSIAADSILEVSGAARSAVLMLDDVTGEPQETVVRTTSDQASEDFNVSRTIVEETLRQGVSLLSSDAGSDHRFKAGDSILMQGIKSVMSVPVCTEDRISGVIYVDTSSVVQVFKEADLQLLAALGKQLGIAIERANLIADLEDLFVGTIHTLVASIEAKDPYTKGHSERVTNYSLVIAQAMGLTKEQHNVVELAGLLHDVGKIGVPELILNKEGKLDDREFSIVKSHPDQGAKIIKNIKNIGRVVNMDDIVQGVLHHHEKYDGTGYPKGLCGNEIPLVARILSIADTYDAITSDRPYRKGRTREFAHTEITDCSSTQFDPFCVAAFDAVCLSGDLDKAKQTSSRFHLKS